MPWKQPWSAKSPQTEADGHVSKHVKTDSAVSNDIEGQVSQKAASPTPAPAKAQNT